MCDVCVRCPYRAYKSPFVNLELSVVHQRIKCGGGGIHLREIQGRRLTHLFLCAAGQPFFESGVSLILACLFLRGGTALSLLARLYEDLGSQREYTLSSYLDWAGGT